MFEFFKDFWSKDKRPEPEIKDEYISETDIISMVMLEYERRKREKLDLELQWQLNANFVAGNQFCEINTETQDIIPVPKVNDYQSREVFNRIGTIYDTRQAKLSQVRPSMFVRPHGNESDDIAKADVATSVLKGLQSVTGFPKYVQKAFAWGDICGSCFFYTWWNDKAGREIIPGVFEGDIDYGILSPFEVFPDNLLNEEIDDCMSIIIRQVKDVNEIYDVYGIRLPGRSCETFTVENASSLGGYGYEASTLSSFVGVRDNAETVTTYFERPTRDYPDGRMAVILGDSTLTYFGPLPFRTKINGERGIPIIKFSSGKRIGQFFGVSYVERLIPVQRAYNAVKNRKLDYLSRCAIGSYQIEEGELSDEDIDKIEQEGFAPGTLITYATGGKGLKLLPLPQLPGAFESEEARLQSEFEYLSGISEMAVISSTPGSNMSGTALNSIKEADSTRLSLVAENMRNAVCDLSQMWLVMCKQMCKIPRILKYTGTNNIANVVVWSSDDITSFDVVPSTENEMTDTLESRREFIMNLLSSGLLADENGVISNKMRGKILEALHFGNWEEASGLSDLHTAKAKRENAFLEYGIIPEIAEFDDHEAHIEEHNNFRLQSKFEVFSKNKPAIADSFSAHIKQHEERIAARQANTMMQAIQAGGMKNADI